MNWILRFMGFMVMMFGFATFFLPSPWWILSPISFVLVLAITASTIISDVADTANKIIQK